MPEETLETPQPQPKTDRPLDETNWTKIILAAVIGLGLLAGSAYAGYYYGAESANLKNQIQETPAPQPTPDSTSEPTSVATDTDFIEKIVKSYSFRDSKGVLKKIAVYDTGDIQTGAYIYLTDASFNPLTAIKVGQFSTACCEVTDMVLSDTEKKLGIMVKKCWFFIDFSSLEI